MGKAADPIRRRCDCAPNGPLAARAGAFTLIELLVVLAIILLLVGIIAPSCLRAIESARLVKCAGNMSGLLGAHSSYRLQYEGAKPPLMRRGRSAVKTDWISPDIKWTNTPVGQGILVDRKFCQFDRLLCPSMERDPELDKKAWETLADSGSSFAYFWQHPNCVEDQTDAGSSAMYVRHERDGLPALLMDINCQEGHQYEGEFAGRSWESHPSLAQVNVAFLDSSVSSYPSAGLVLQFPGGSFEELQWFDAAHQLKKRK